MNKAVVVFSVLLTLIIAGAVLSTSSYFQERKATVTVQKAFTDTEGQTTYYLVVTTDGRLFEINPVWWKLSSMNPDLVWASLQAGQTYCFTYAGWQWIAAWAGVYWYYDVYNVVNGACAT